MAPILTFSCSGKEWEREERGREGKGRDRGGEISGDTKKRRCDDAVV
jgi:hypothetical protein